MKFVSDTMKAMISYGLVAASTVIGFNVGKYVYHEIIEPKLNDLCRGNDVESIPEDEFIEE